jgi:hypothetical protein
MLKLLLLMELLWKLKTLQLADLLLVDLLLANLLLVDLLLADLLLRVKLNVPKHYLFS